MDNESTHPAYDSGLSFGKGIIEADYSDVEAGFRAGVRAEEYFGHDVEAMDQFRYGFFAGYQR